MPKQTECRTFAGEILRITDRAALFAPKDRDDAEQLGIEPGSEIWVPKSVCRDGDSLEEGGNDIEIATWWVNKQLA